MSNETSTMQAVESVSAGSYIGYVWYSDAQYPEVYLPGATLTSLSLPKSGQRLVMEAQLVSEDKTCSYSVKFADGRYVAIRYSLTALSALVQETKSKVQVTEHRYLAHRMPMVEALYFDEYWHPEPDDNCNDMEVLRAREFVFVGFTR